MHPDKNIDRRTLRHVHLTNEEFELLLAEGLRRGLVGVNENENWIVRRLIVEVLIRELPYLPQNSAGG